MKLLDVDSYIDKYHDGKKPDRKQVQKWCRENHLPAKKIGGMWFVDTDKLDLEDEADFLLRKAVG